MAIPSLHNNSPEVVALTDDRALRAIARGGLESIQDLARAIGATRSGAHCAFARLEAAGLVAADPGSGPARIPRLTAAGAEELRQRRSRR